jgi:hypothetical protein
MESLFFKQIFECLVLLILFRQMDYSEPVLPEISEVLRDRIEIMRTQGGWSFMEH